MKISGHWIDKPKRKVAFYHSKQQQIVRLVLWFVVVDFDYWRAA